MQAGSVINEGYNCACNINVYSLREQSITYTA